MNYVVDVDGTRFVVGLDGSEARVDGTTWVCQLQDVPGAPVHVVTIGRDVHRVAVRRGDARGAYTLWINGRRFDVDALDERTRAIRDLTAASARDSGPRPLVAPMPGLIVRVSVQVGDRVEAGQGLVVMEAMKMENELRAPSAGVVTAVHATAGAAVEKGSVLIELGA
jgi:pyruvate carboxylase subunit B